jgi:hypothetical protein
MKATYQLMTLTHAGKVAYRLDYVAGSIVDRLENSILLTGWMEQD